MDSLCATFSTFFFFGRDEKVGERERERSFDDGEVCRRVRPYMDRSDEDGQAD